MRKKAQITMESLLLYGAAILVVLLAIAALTYFGVLDLGRLLPDKCNFEGTGGLRCDDYRVTNAAGEHIQIEVTNKATKAFDISAMGSSFTSEDSGIASGCTLASDQTITPGETETLKFVCTSYSATVGSRISGTAQLNYTLGGSLTHVGFGYLTATTS